VQLSLSVELHDVGSAVAGDIDQLPQRGNAVVRIHWYQRRRALHAPEFDAERAAAVELDRRAIVEPTSCDRRAVRVLRHGDRYGRLGRIIAPEYQDLLETRLAGVAVGGVSELVVAQADVAHAATLLGHDLDSRGVGVGVGVVRIRRWLGRIPECVPPD